MVKVKSKQKMSKLIQYVQGNKEMKGTFVSLSDKCEVWAVAFSGASLSVCNGFVGVEALPCPWLPPHLHQMALTIMSDGGIYLAGLSDQSHPFSATLTYLYSLHSRWGIQPSSLWASGGWLWVSWPALLGKRRKQSSATLMDTHTYTQSLSAIRGERNISLQCSVS